MCRTLAEIRKICVQVRRTCGFQIRYGWCGVADLLRDFLLRMPSLADTCQKIRQLFLITRRFRTLELQASPAVRQPCGLSATRTTTRTGARQDSSLAKLH